jgi:hypothetical protein
VIGVTPNGFFSGLRRGAPPHVVFLSMQPQPPAPGETILYARHDGDLAAIAPAIGRALKDVDARIPVEQMQSLAAASDAFTWPARVITILLTIFAVGSPLHQELLKDVPYPRADILFDREHRSIWAACTCDCSGAARCTRGATRSSSSRKTRCCSRAMW